MYEVYIDDVYLPTHEQLKRISSTNILRWEPIQKEKDLIKSTWNDDFNFLYELGANIYVYIFEKVPECKKLFPKIHQHGDNYKNSPEFRSQALKFVQTLSYAVKHLYHMNDLATYLRKIGQMHVKLTNRGFKPIYWNIFLDAIESVLVNKIASIKQFNEEQRNYAIKVWRRLALYIVVQMKCGYYEKLR